MTCQAQAKPDDATVLHMRQLEDHFLATAAADPDAWIQDLAFIAVAHACWEGGLRWSAQSDGGEGRRGPALQPGAVLRALGQVLCMSAEIDATFMPHPG